MVWENPSPIKKRSKNKIILYNMDQGLAQMMGGQMMAMASMKENVSIW